MTRKETFEELANRVRARAHYRCEYCQRPQSDSIFTFHIDHVIARKHGGKTTFGNLALACPQCNFHKSSDIASYALVKKKRVLVPLYNPRRHRWHKHFRWDGPRLLALTVIGRVTIHVLDTNAPDKIAMREASMADGAFPPLVNLD